MRQIVLDTETTGLEPSQGHRIIEIGCVELIDRKLTGRHYHQYLQPDREIDQGAMEVHGITNEFLQDKPRFYQIVNSFLDFIGSAELVIHNAPFDVGFLNHELELLNNTDPDSLAASLKLADRCAILDSLLLARKKHPGQKNNLDALCRRYEVDNSSRELHGALLDAEILADVYLAMTGGQTNLELVRGPVGGSSAQELDTTIARIPLPVIKASEAELKRHRSKCSRIGQKSDLW